MVLVALNKNQRGKISPLEFNMNLNQAIQKVYTDLFTEFKKLDFKKSRLQSTANYGDEAGYIKQAIEYYIFEKRIKLRPSDDAVGPNIIDYPKDYMLVNSIFSEDNEFSKTDLNQFNMLKRSSRMKPSKCSAIYAIKNGLIEVIPETESVDFVYLRKPKLAKWTFRIHNGVELYDPSLKDFQDIDIHPLMIDRLFISTLSICGLNLREREVHEYIQMMKQEEIQNSQ